MKKLSLTRETLQRLSTDQVRLAGAGAVSQVYAQCGTGIHTLVKPNCQDSRLKCWVSELYTACCPTGLSLAADCIQN